MLRCTSPQSCRQRPVNVTLSRETRDSAQLKPPVSRSSRSAEGDRDQGGKEEQGSRRQGEDERVPGLGGPGEGMQPHQVTVGAHGGLVGL